MARPASNDLAVAGDGIPGGERFQRSAGTGAGAGAGAAAVKATAAKIRASFISVLGLETSLDSVKREALILIR